MNYFLGIDMGGTAIKAGAFSMDGALLESRTAPTRDGERTEGHPTWAVHVRNLVAELRNAFAVAPLGMGLSCPGLVATDRRSIASMPNRLHGLEGFDWSHWIGAGCLVPVLNDAHAALLGEVWRGAARDCRNVVLLTLGTGVGGAAMVDGHLLRGHLGRAGHLGHVTVNHSSEEQTIFGMPGGLECHIGNYNVGVRSGGRFTTTRDLTEAVVSGDEQARVVWQKSIHALGCAVASFINAFDPEVVLVGGGIAEAGPLLWEPLQRVLDHAEWRPTGNSVPVRKALLGDWAGTYGAAYEALCDFSPSISQTKL